MPQSTVCPTCGVELPENAPEGLCPRCLLSSGLANTPPSAVEAVRVATSPYQEMSWTAPTPAELAQHFPQLTILELLGQGGMGAVYKARQVKLDRLVALKILPPEAGRDAAFAERFAREARALARLSHPGIVGVHDFGEAGGYFYFLMEFVDGVNLRHLLYHRQLTPADALALVPQVCDALQYAHDEGVVHRDVKPENILIDRKGRAKIADFGLAKLLNRGPAERHLTHTRQVMGTPHYMAPEQMERPSSVDHRADVYSLGVVFYEMLTGELPLGRFSPPSQRAPVEPRLDPVVLRALEKDPGRRYQKVSDVKADLEWIDRLAGPPLAATTPPVPQEDFDQEMLRLQVKGPATGLMLTALLALLAGLGAAFGVIISILTSSYYGYSRSQMSELTQALLIIFPIAPVALMAVGILWLGARRMMRFERYEFVLLASMWAMLPWSPTVLLGFPVGVWALLTLRRPEVKKAFIRRALQSYQASLVPPQEPTGGVGRKLQSALGAAQSLIFSSRVDGAVPGPAARRGAGGTLLLGGLCLLLTAALAASLTLLISRSSPTPSTMPAYKSLPSQPVPPYEGAGKTIMPFPGTPKSDTIGATKK